MIEVNYLAVFVATVIAYVISTIWYMPHLFGNRWMKLSGITMKKGEKIPMSTMVLGFVSFFIMNLVMAYLVSLSQITTVSMALFFGLFLWIGFVAVTLLSQVLYEKRSVELYLINATHYLIGMAISCSIFVLWN
jgi:hypothetical protein